MTVPDPNLQPHAYVPGTLPGVFGRKPPCKRCVRDEGHHIHAPHQLEAARHEITRLRRELAAAAQSAEEWKQEAQRHLGNHLRAEGRYEATKRRFETYRANHQNP